MTAPYPPEEALRDAAATRVRTANRTGTTVGHYALEGLGAAFVVGGVALARGTWTLILMTAGLLVIVLAARAYRASHGVWPRFRGAPRGVQLAWGAWVATYLCLLCAAFWVREAVMDPSPAGWGLVAAALLTLPAIGLEYDAQVRAGAERGTR